MTNPEQFLTDLNEAVDDAHSRLDRLESRNKTFMLIAGGAAALGAINAFFCLQAIRAVANLAQGVNQIGELAVKHEHTFSQLFDTNGNGGGKSVPGVPDGGTDTHIDSPVAPPAEGPRSEAPEWVAQANASEILSEVIKEGGVEP